MSNGWAVGLIVAAVLLGGGFAGYLVIKHKIEQVSMAAFGTKSLAEGISRQADVLAETPKSVSAMTRIFAPQIAKDFPDFNLEEFRKLAENLLIAAFAAVTAGSAGRLTGSAGETTGAGEALKRQVEDQIADNRAAGVKEVYAGVRIHQTEIANYQKKNGTCTITFQSAVEHIHYKEQNGTVTEGEKERKQQTKYNTELVYIQDEKQTGAGNATGTTCPNCGAPITSLGAMKCEYCGLAVTPVNRKVWTFHRYYEVDYHRI